jgi:hypothetical protein
MECDLGNMQKLMARGEELFDNWSGVTEENHAKSLKIMDHRTEIKIL